MKTIFLPLIVYAFTLFSLQSCVDGQDDPEPRGTATRNFSLTGFDELEMGNAFQVHVKAGDTYAITATGELNDLDDLEVFTEEGELTVRYKDWRKNRKEMKIEVTMPTLSGVEFSGAVDAGVYGFDNIREIDFELSGASHCDFIGSAKNIEVDLSGASYLSLIGSGKFLEGTLSGASELNSFDYQTEESDLKLSGASKGEIHVSKFLKVEASGASKLRYLGTPNIQKKVSGGSTVSQD